MTQPLSQKSKLCWNVVPALDMTAYATHKTRAKLAATLLVTSLLVTLGAMAIYSTQIGSEINSLAFIGQTITANSEAFATALSIKLMICSTYIFWDPKKKLASPIPLENNAVSSSVVIGADKDKSLSSNSLQMESPPIAPIAVVSASAKKEASSPLSVPPIQNKNTEKTRLQLLLDDIFALEKCLNRNNVTISEAGEENKNFQAFHQGCLNDLEFGILKRRLQPYAQPVSYGVFLKNSKITSNTTNFILLKTTPEHFSSLTLALLRLDYSMK